MIRHQATSILVENVNCSMNNKNGNPSVICTITYNHFDASAIYIDFNHSFAIYIPRFIPMLFALFNSFCSLPFPFKFQYHKKFLVVDQFSN